MRIVFFGTPPFAVPSLRALAGEGGQVVAVVTQPDRPVGRSRSQLVPPAVKDAALALGLPVLQPERPRGDLFLANLKRLQPDLGVVVAYGHLLGAAVLAVPHRGMINVHASLLPRHRGAAPVPAALLAGDRETGVTIMQLDRGMDTGPTLLARATPIEPRDTAGELTERLADLGAQALVEALVLIQRGDVVATPQDETRATYAPKISRDSARIDWTAAAVAVDRHTRAFDPHPGAWTTFAEAPVKLFDPAPAEGRGAPGEVLEVSPRLVVATGDGAISFGAAQPAGRRQMAAAEWCRGSGPRPGARLE